MTMAAVPPVLDEDVLGSVFFLYRSVDDAQKCIRPAGAGFLVRVSDAVFAVAHAQVIRDGYTVVKWIAKDWSETYVETRPAEWMTVDPDLGVRRAGMSDLPAVSAGALLSREQIAYGFGPGETAITVSGPAGRHDVGAFSPLMRFGRIASVDPGLIGVEQRGSVDMAGALAFTLSLHVLGISDGAGSLIPAWRISAVLAQHKSDPALNIAVEDVSMNDTYVPQHQLEDFFFPTSEPDGTKDREIDRELAPSQPEMSQLSVQFLLLSRFVHK